MKKEMRIKKLMIMAAMLLFFVACGNNNDKGEGADNDGENFKSSNSSEQLLNEPENENTRPESDSAHADNVMY